MGTVEDTWRAIMAVDNIKASVKSDEAGKLLFSFDLYDEMVWFMQLIKKNHEHFIGVEATENKNEFKMKSIYPDLYTFKTNLVPRPGKKKSVPKTKRLGFGISQLPYDGIHQDMVAVKPIFLTKLQKEAKGERLRSREVNKNFEEVKEVIKEGQKTWKEFFQDLHYHVFIKEKLNSENKFIRWEVYFYEIDEIREFIGSNDFKRYKLSICVDKKRKISIHRPKPDLN